MAESLRVVDEYVARETPVLGVVTGDRVRRVAAVLLPFLFWEVAARLADNRLLPAPLEVVDRLIEDILSGRIWFHGRLTIFRGVVGLAIAVVSGVGLGFLLARVKWVEATLEPLVTASYPIPKLALFPFLILLFGFGGASKIAMVALECAYPITYNTYAGVQGVDRRFLWVARNAGAGGLARFGVLLRAALPSIMASLRMAVPIMLVIMVVTELIGESRGLGFLIRKAGSDFQPASALGVVLLLAVIGFVLDRLVVALTRRVAFWARGVRI